MPEDKDVVLKIASNKDNGYAKKVAGAMSWRLRETGICKSRAIKMSAVNTAIKAVAIVNQRVSSAGVLFAIDPFFGEVLDGAEDSKSTAIEMTIKEALQNKPAEFSEYKVSGKQESEDKEKQIDEKDLATKLAGAIAGAVRQGRGIRLRCIGPSAVYRGVYASIIAKGYIYPNGIESIIVPTWTSMPPTIPNGPVISLIQIEFWGNKL